MLLGVGRGPRSLRRAEASPPALLPRRFICTAVNVSTDTIAGCAGRRERTIRSADARRNRVTCPAATSSGSSNVSCRAQRPKMAYPV